MIVRDDSERGIPPLVTHQPPSSLDDAPVIRGRMVQIPGWIIPLYAGLFIALGWFGGEQWRHPAPPQTLPLPVAHAALLPLTAAGEAAQRRRRRRQSQRARGAGSGQRYAAASALQRPCLRLATGKAQHCVKRQSVDGGRFTPLPNLVVEQIQQDVTIFSFNGTTFTLAALEDWPGGKIDEEPKEE